MGSLSRLAHRAGLATERVLDPGSVCAYGERKVARPKCLRRQASEAGRGVLERAGREALLPGTLVRPQIAHQLSPGAVGIEGDDLGLSRGDHLQDAARLKVASVNHQGGARILAQELRKACPAPRQPPGAAVLPQVPDWSDGGTNSRNPGDERLREKLFNVETRVNLEPHVVVHSSIVSLASCPKLLPTRPRKCPRPESNQRTRVGVACDADLEHVPALPVRASKPGHTEMPPASHNPNQTARIEVGQLRLSPRGARRETTPTGRGAPRYLPFLSRPIGEQLHGTL